MIVILIIIYQEKANVSIFTLQLVQLNRCIHLDFKCK